MSRRASRSGLLRPSLAFSGRHPPARTIKATPRRADVGPVRRRPRGAALAVAAGLLLTAVPAQVGGAQAAQLTATARSESAADAQAAAQRAADKVDALQPRVKRALRAYRRALAQISGSVSRSVLADQQADETAAHALAQRRVVDNEVRALYMSGGSVALFASVLTAPTATDALRRVAYVQRLVETTSFLANDSAATADGDAARATQLEAAADHEVVTAGDVTRRSDQLSDALAEAASSLNQLSDHARTLAVAERAAASLQALALSAGASEADRVATARAAPIPTDFRKLYVGSAKTCQGLSWTVLAAIGQVESGHGRNPSTSYSGAQGPMQFLPSTFAAYAVDGDQDGNADIMDPADAIFTAAHYLCANGGGHGADGLHNAIWHYNHAEWYVDLVLKLASELAGQEPATTLGE
jgi:peptidoglycan hydrolase CwlO-like protein